MSKISQEEALERLRHTCSRSEKCLFDIQQKLIQWDLEDSFLHIKDELLKDKFIDEERYTLAFVNDKIRFSKWGKIKIQYHLKMKGIDNTHISQAFETFPQSDYRKIVFDELNKRAKKLKLTGNNYQEWSKLFRFATQRGYETELVKVFKSEWIPKN